MDGWRSEPWQTKAPARSIMLCETDASTVEPDPVQSVECLNNGSTHCLAMRRAWDTYVYDQGSAIRSVDIRGAYLGYVKGKSTQIIERNSEPSGVSETWKYESRTREEMR